MPSRSNKMYTPLEDKSDHESQSSSEDTEGLLTSTQNRFSSANSTWKYILLALIPFTGIISLGFGIWIGSSFAANANKICPPHVQKYSPILKEVDTSIHMVRFNGSLMKENVFRKEAGPEVDAAWASLGVDYRSLAVPLSEGPKSGFRADQVKINPKHGGGFPANVEGLHHLHCLNLLRQSLYYNIDYYRARGQGAFLNDDYIVRHHVSHCLDIIRQQLMCQPNTGMLGQVWWDRKAPKSYVDFNTEHKCKNFDAIRQWAEDHQLPEDVPEDFLEPPKIDDLIYDELP